MLLFRSLQQLQVEKLLGEGRLSSVMLCHCLISGLKLALKVYHKQGMTMQNCKQVLRTILPDAASTSPEFHVQPELHFPYGF